MAAAGSARSVWKMGRQARHASSRRVQGAGRELARAEHGPEQGLRMAWHAGLMGAPGPSCSLPCRRRRRARRRSSGDAASSGSCSSAPSERRLEFSHPTGRCLKSFHPNACLQPGRGCSAGLAAGSQAQHLREGEPRRRLIAAAVCGSPLGDPCFRPFQVCQV